MRRPRTWLTSTPTRPGATLSASDKTDLLRASLQQDAQLLAPDSPLGQQLQAYIDSLNGIPKDVCTRVHFQEDLSTGQSSGGQYARQPGGSVVPGMTYTVGEGGVPETLVMLPGSLGGYVIPHPGQPQQPAPSRVINNYLSVTQSNPSPYEIAQAVARAVQ